MGYTATLRINTHQLADISIDFPAAIDVLINTASDSLNTVFDYWQIRTGSATVTPNRVSLRDGGDRF